MAQPKANALVAEMNRISDIAAQMRAARWYPGEGDVFVLTNQANPQDGSCNLLWLCISRGELENHIVGKPFAALRDGDADTAPPQLLAKNRYFFSPGEEAMHALGLTAAIKRELVKLHAQRPGLDS